MEITEPRRLYQQLAADLKERIEQGVYLVGDKLPAERFIADEKNVSRTVVREAIIMLEVEGYVEVRKGSGIHVVSNQPRHQQAADNNMEFANYGPFELLQARQLIEILSRSDTSGISASLRIENASVCKASPARIAFASPNFTWQVGKPRRRSSSSIAGKSS